MRIGAGRLLLLTLAVALITMKPVFAAQVRRLEVTHDNGTYFVTFDVLLIAEAATVRAILGDYTQWPRLSDRVKEAYLLKTFADGRQRVNLGFRSCVLIFCKTIRQVKDVENLSNGNIVATVVPAHGDFTSGWEHWRIITERDQTRVQYRAALVPGHRVPPLLGRWILASNFRRTLTKAANNLETLAAIVASRSPVQGASGEGVKVGKLCARNC